VRRLDEQMAGGTSAKDLVARITALFAAYNARSRPFAWTAAADILAQLGRTELADDNQSAWR
jgi:hypothetical protein